MREYFKNTLKIIDESIESLDDEMFQKLIDECTICLKNGGKIVASGLGKNVPICEKFVGTMSSFGLDSCFLHSNTAMHGDLGMIKPNDVVIVLSKSGNTRESIELIENLPPKKANLWIMTFNKNGKMSNYTDKSIILDLLNEGDQWNIAPNNSTTIFLIVLQALAVELSKTMGVTIDDFKLNHPGGGIGAKLKGIK